MQIYNIYLYPFCIHPQIQNINPYSYLDIPLWIGSNLQVTLMNIYVGDDIELEIHETNDQFIRIKECQVLVKIKYSKYNLNFQKMISDDCAIIIPFSEGAELAEYNSRY